MDRSLSVDRRRLVELFHVAPCKWSGGCPRVRGDAAGTGDVLLEFCQQVGIATAEALPKCGRRPNRWPASHSQAGMRFAASSWDSLMANKERSTEAATD